MQILTPLMRGEGSIVPAKAGKDLSPINIEISDEIRSAVNQNKNQWVDVMSIEGDFVLMYIDAVLVAGSSPNQIDFEMILNGAVVQEYTANWTGSNAFTTAVFSSSELVRSFSGELVLRARSRGNELFTKGVRARLYEW